MKRNRLGLVGGENPPIGYDEYIWISDRCVEGIDYCIEHGMEYKVFDNPLQSEPEIKQAITYLKSIKQRMIEYLTKELNTYHHLQYTEKQWNVLLTFWLTSFISTLYDKHLRLLRVEKEYSNCEVNLYKDYQYVPPLDFYEYWNKAATSREYNICLYQQIIQSRDLNYGLIKKENMECEIINLATKVRRIGYYKVKAYEVFQSIYKGITRKQEKVVINESYLPYSFLAYLWKKSKGDISPYITDYAGNTRNSIHYRIDYSWRNQDIKFKTKDDFEEICISLIRRNLPIVYLEGFDCIEKIVNRKYKYAKKANAIFFAGGAATEEVFKHYLAQMAETAELCGIQHGGNYGIDEMWMHEDEWDICNRFYTWGWKKNNVGNCKFISMPAAKLMNVKNSQNNAGEKILYVSYTVPRYFTSTWPRVMNYKKDKDSEIEFLSKLSDRVKKKMIVRLQPIKSAWSVREDIEKAVSGMSFDSEPDFYESLNQARLVVLFDWSTTVLEALYMDKPILVLRDESFILPEAAEDIEKLKKIGIVRNDWESLLQKLEEVSMDIDSWWKNTEVQKAIADIKGKYTYVPKNARDIWENEIYMMAKEK